MKCRNFFGKFANCSFHQFFKVHHAWNKCTPANASLWCIFDGFLGVKGLVHQKVHDARVNVVDPLAPGSARKQYSKNKEMLIFNLVSQYAQIPDKQNYLQEVGGIMKL